MKGHKLIRSWSGPNDAYANGRCACGHWHTKGWTDRMGQVVRAHAGHVRRLNEGKGVVGHDLPKPQQKESAQ